MTRINTFLCIWNMHSDLNCIPGTHLKCINSSFPCKREAMTLALLTLFYYLSHKKVHSADFSQAKLNTLHLHT